MIILVNDAEEENEDISNIKKSQNMICPIYNEK